MTFFKGNERELICTFNLGNRRCGIHLDEVGEIGTKPELLVLPHAPQEVMGLFSLRGTFVLVLDPTLCFGWEKGTEAALGLIVLKPFQEECYALLVSGHINIEPLGSDSQDALLDGQLTREACIQWTKDQEGKDLPVIKAYEMLKMCKKRVDFNYEKQNESTQEF